MSNQITKIVSIFFVFFAFVTLSCQNTPDITWCSINTPNPSQTPVEYHTHVAPILEAKCNRCHTKNGHAPFVFGSYKETFDAKNAIRNSVSQRKMPPWQATSCCNQYFRDWSLTDKEIGMLVGWVNQGAPEGAPLKNPTQPSTTGNISRVDLELPMGSPYMPAPPAGSTDDLRCFVLDWPYQDTRFITGMEVLPGNRSIVHHIVVATTTEDGIEDINKINNKDGKPGWSCTNGTGGVRNVTILGGSLLGGDFPRGLGKEIKPGSKLILQMHYSVARTQTPQPDKSTLRLKIEKGAIDFKSIVVTNPMWLVGDAMKVPAGEKEAVFTFAYQPKLFTQSKKVVLQSVSAHMHAFGSKFSLGIINKNNEQKCLLQIDSWQFGWEQVYWLNTPITLNKDERLYVECHFDNSVENQPIINGVRQAPRDIAWGGNDQDMCAGFVNFTPLE